MFVGLEFSCQSQNRAVSNYHVWKYCKQVFFAKKLTSSGALPSAKAQFTVFDDKEPRQVRRKILNGPAFLAQALLAQFAVINVCFDLRHFTFERTAYIRDAATGLTLVY
jgi:hypothetical protein